MRANESMRVLDDERLIDRAGAGDLAAPAVLFGRYRKRLRQKVRLRLDCRLHGRVDASDVLQGAAMRDAGREVSLYKGALPQASSASLAAQLLGQYTPASEAFSRAEVRIQIQTALERLQVLLEPNPGLFDRMR